MAGEFEREPWLDGNLEQHRITASGTLVTPSGSFYLITMNYENLSGANNAANLKDGGAAGTIMISTVAIDDTTNHHNFSKAPIVFATDVYGSKAVGLGQFAITGYDY